MKLSILVPFRDADGTRTRAKEWIIRRWAHFYPDAEIIESSDDGVDPFNKSMAVNRAAKQATGDIFVILDADTWCDSVWVERAIDWISETRGHWAIPCRTALRLKRDVSEQLMALDPSAALPSISHKDAETRSAVVGFLWVVKREAFEAVGGMDERIRGWGGEDTMFTRAMTVVNGAPRKGSGTLISLWHDRPRDSRNQRVWVGQGERSEEYEKEALARRYGMARNKAAMLEVLQR